jgi:GNAT superfamily N-acetyltransferase
MAIELDRLRPAGVPRGVVVAEAREGWTPTTLPYDGVESTNARHVLARARPRRVWHVGAWRDGRPVGHAVVSVTAGRLGAAGLYDVGVERGERRRGIGRAVTLAALDVARSLGCGVATLNATPEGEALYRAMGFRSVGVAQTWWLHLRR